jgi:hypothetical protein
MMDPLYLDPTDYEYYKQRNPPPGGFRGYDEPRSIAQLHADLNKAHDNMKKQQHVNDVLWKTLMTERKWRRRLVRALIASWVLWSGAFWYVFKWAAPYIIQGIGK